MDQLVCAHMCSQLWPEWYHGISLESATAGVFKPENWQYNADLLKLLLFPRGLVVLGRNSSINLSCPYSSDVYAEKIRPWLLAPQTVSQGCIIASSLEGCGNTSLRNKKKACLLLAINWRILEGQSYNTTHCIGRYPSGSSICPLGLGGQGNPMWAC